LPFLLNLSFPPDIHCIHTPPPALWITSTFLNFRITSKYDFSLICFSQPLAEFFFALVVKLFRSLMPYRSPPPPLFFSPGSLFPVRCPGQNPFLILFVLSHYFSLLLSSYTQLTLDFPKPPPNCDVSPYSLRECSLQYSPPTTPPI